MDSTAEKFCEKLRFFVCVQFAVLVPHYVWGCLIVGLRWKWGIVGAPGKSKGHNWAIAVPEVSLKVTSSQIHA